MNYLSEVNESLIAAVVRGLIIILKTTIPPLKRWWEQSEWRNLVIFGLCVLAPLAMWFLECPPGGAWDPVDIPAFNPRCNLEGIIIDVLYAAAIAFMFNFVGEKGFDWMKDKIENRAVQIVLRWLDNLWFWVFVATVVVEFFLLQAGLSWQSSLVVSVVFTIATTILAVLVSPRLRLLEVQSPFNSDIMWWIMMGLKVIIHILPIPFWLKPILSIGLTILVFILVNLFSLLGGKI